MIHKPTRREMLIGGLATTIMGTLATSVVAKGIRSSKLTTQGTGDPIVSVPATVDASASSRFFVTVYPPASYTPNVQFTVKIVRMVFGTDSENEMDATYVDTGLDGIVDGEFSTTITFPANSGPINVSVFTEEMSSQNSKVYTAVVYNGSNSASGTFTLTP